MVRMGRMVKTERLRLRVKHSCPELKNVDGSLDVESAAGT